MRLTDRSMLRIANDVRAADLLAADIDRRRRRVDDDHPGPVGTQGRPAYPARPGGLRRLIPGGNHA